RRSGRRPPHGRNAGGRRCRPVRGPSPHPDAQRRVLRGGTAPRGGRVRSVPGDPGMRTPVDWGAVRAVIWKDVTAVKRSKAVVLPMLLLPAVMLLGLPVVVGF